MPILALHDTDGAIAALIVSPDDGPPAAGLSDLPHRVSEVEGTETASELTREAGEHKAIDVLRSLRVEAAPPARLVRGRESS